MALSAPPLLLGQHIRINGTVQGVGFRPSVWRLAQEEGIVGAVWNDAGGVAITAWADARGLKAFVARLRREVPLLARIEAITVTPLEGGGPPPDSFRIIESEGGEVHTAITADAATCPDCLAEIFDPTNRRYRYPFTNCTHCGPRFSIVRAVPYDRVNTSMAVFEMCPSCRAEYEDPADRRFHAQPNCCRECGPQLWLEDGGGKRLLHQGDAMQHAAHLIRQGKIVAIKGIGGFHLACDAANEEAVGKLRQRKQRHHKPFALMARDLEMVRGYAQVDAVAETVLCDAAAPVVLLPRNSGQLAEGVAPGIDTVGFMLPYTPLHHLLMYEVSRPIVLTSGNHSNEPQALKNDEAIDSLGGIADYFLLHDREIVNRLDDSVIRPVDGRSRMVRRGRGYAPRPIKLPSGFPVTGGILAMGAELKNSFCLVKDGSTIASQHMGDLETATSYQCYRHSIELYRHLFDFSPSAVAVDRHPDYRSSQLGQQLAAAENIPIIEVQHHHAHIAACMAEHGLPLGGGKVLGVVLDGLGYGDDGTLWGGEFLLADYGGYERLAHFESVAMPGGAQAIHQPWRNTVAQLSHHLGWESVAEEYAQLELVKFLQGKPVTTLQGMMRGGINSPAASSAGRLFDAVAAALGICRENSSYEGQAAIELEALAAPWFLACEQAYGYELRDNRLNWEPLWRELLEDLREGVEPGVISARFHHGIARAIWQTAVRYCSNYTVDTVVLAGGVFQNRLLLEHCSKALRRQGVRVLFPSSMPCNDGGLSLGQAVIASADANR